jgi:diphthine synthase
MLWFVGAGINGYRGLSLAAVDVLKKCDIVYVERFTISLSEEDIAGLGSVTSRQPVPVQRWFVEDGREMLEAAKTKQIALVTYGDPQSSTDNCALVAARKSSSASPDSGSRSASSASRSIQSRASQRPPPHR